MGDYFIKDSYVHGTANASVETAPGDYWTDKRVRESRYHQHAVYDEAAYWVQKRGARTVLDVGCGMPTKLMELLAPIAECTGVDQETVMAEARRRWPRGNFIGVDLEEPDQPPDGTFDLIICADVIEHLANPDLLLRYIRDHCNDDTIVIISTPERDMLRGPDNNASPQIEHVREWNANELVSYLATSGFRLVRHMIVPAFRVGSPSLVVERLRFLRKAIPLRTCQVAVCCLRECQQMF
jgi:SAM-dependent methyltransferase